MPPFLRWVGGKTRLVKELAQLLPVLEKTSTYFEPFLGAGSLFFHRTPDRAVLNDSNHRLIDCYQSVKDRPELVWRYLRPLLQCHSPAEYYEIRNRFNGGRLGPYQQSAQFIYLNKMCFNGIWRVNRAGLFNGPFRREGRCRISLKPEVARSLEYVEDYSPASCDSQDAVEYAKRGDFVYFDPSYVPLSSTAFSPLHRHSIQHGRPRACRFSGR